MKFSFSPGHKFNESQGETIFNSIVRFSEQKRTLSLDFYRKITETILFTNRTLKIQNETFGFFFFWFSKEKHFKLFSFDRPRCPFSKYKWNPVSSPNFTERIVVSNELAVEFDTKIFNEEKKRNSPSVFRLFILTAINSFFDAKFGLLFESKCDVLSIKRKYFFIKR